MLHLPTSTSSLRSLFDVADLAALGTAEARAKVPTFRAAIANAREFFAGEPAAREITSLCLRADGALWLVTIGRAGGWRRRWNFGAI